MFLKFFSEMNIKKLHSLVFLGGSEETFHFLLEVELLVFINIQAISTLQCLLLDDNGFLVCNYSIIFGSLNVFNHHKQ